LFCDFQGVVCVCVLVPIAIAGFDARVFFFDLTNDESW
jgi:hypothetical protein